MLLSLSPAVIMSQFLRIYVNKNKSSSGVSYGYFRSKVECSRGRVGFSVKADDLLASVRLSSIMQM